MFKEFGRMISNMFESITQGVKATRIDERTEPIVIAYPPEGLQALTLQMGVGELTVNPGGTDLVNGTAVYNVAEWQPEITTEAGQVVVKQGSGWAIWPDDLHNRWDFTLGTAHPYALKLRQGFAKGMVNLAGVPLTNLEVESGAGECKLKFGAANPAEMAAFVVRAGAGEFSAEALLHSNAAEYVVECGAGKATLHFTGGSPKRDVKGRFSVGVGEITISVAAGLPVQVVVSKGLGGVKAGGTFRAVAQENRTVYETPEFASASGPKMVFEVTAGMGGINLLTE